MSYRKVDQKTWNDEKFQSLPRMGKLLFLMLLTHPNMTALGAMRTTISGLAEELGEDEGEDPEAFQQAFQQAFQEVRAKGMVEYDKVGKLLDLPNFLKYNHPESPNVVKAWVWAADQLPQCEAKNRVIARAQAFVEGLSEGFRNAFAEAFPKAMPNQQQQQQQQPEPKPTCLPASTGDSGDREAGRGVEVEALAPEPEPKPAYVPASTGDSGDRQAGRGGEAEALTPGRAALRARFLQEGVRDPLALVGPSSLPDEMAERVAEKFEAYVAVVKASGATDPKAALAARCRDLTLTHPKVTLLEPRPPEGASVASAVPITSPLISTDCDEAAARAWEAVWEALRETMYENSFQEWIAPLTCLGFKSGATLPVLVVGTVSPFHRQWVEESFGEELAAAIAGVRAGLWLEGLTVEILTTDEADSVEIAQNFAV